jgi:hypothetical protein
MNLFDLKNQYQITINIVFTKHLNVKQIETPFLFKCQNSKNFANEFMQYIKMLLKETYWEFPGMFACYENHIEFCFDNVSISGIAENSNFTFKIFETDLYNEFEKIRYC